jgi:hypothetical protein
MVILTNVYDMLWRASTENESKVVWPLYAEEHRQSADGPGPLDIKVMVQKRLGLA